eukprot:751540-Hanusia_phi.AAC.8
MPTRSDPDSCFRVPASRSRRAGAIHHGIIFWGFSAEYPRVKTLSSSTLLPKRIDRVESRVEIREDVTLSEKGSKTARLCVQTPLAPLQCTLDAILVIDYCAWTIALQEESHRLNIITAATEVSTPRGVPVSAGGTEN